MPAFLLRRAGLAIVLAASATLAFSQAQKSTADYEPQSGQEGKDVVWVPTPQALVDRMLRMARVTPDDFVMDLGSGDGRTVISAAKIGARALGIEYNPDMVTLSRRNAAKEGVTSRAQFAKADLFETDFSKATVITMFLLPDINLKLRPKILEMKPGTRVVSNSFDMGDWRPDDRQTVTAQEGCNVTWCTAMLWIVPARVNGTYKVAQGEVTFKQQYQMLSGTLRTAGSTYVLDGQVHGDDIRFRAGGKAYRGRLNGKGLELHQE